MIVELFCNSLLIIQSVGTDWSFPNRSFYSENFKDIENLVNKTKDDNSNFYRLENLDSMSKNESLNFGYSGISQFSSVRNRSSSILLNKLGYRSIQPNQKTSYKNNTILMDSFFGVKYLLSKQNVSNYGFKMIDHSNKVKMYENKFALSTAYSSPLDVEKINITSNNILTNQKNLINSISNNNYEYYSLVNNKIVQSTNTEIIKDKAFTSFTPKDQNTQQVIEYDIEVPKDSQIYLNLYPGDFSKLNSVKVGIELNGNKRVSSLIDDGQFYNLGYYKNATNVKVKVIIEAKDTIILYTPTAIRLNTKELESSINSIKSSSYKMHINKDSASVEGEFKDTQDLITTIPYSKGWKAYIDEKSTPIKSLDNGLIVIKVPKGYHKIVFKYTTPGLTIGIIASIIGCIGIIIVHNKLN